MPAQFFRPSSSLGGAPMAALPRLYDSSATYKIGALLVTDTDGEVIECSADPATVLGVAGEPANSTPGFLMQNSPTVITGRKREVPVWLARGDLLFIGSAVNGGTDPVTPALTNIGEEYGVVKDANGIWRIDIAETSAKVIHIEQIDIPTKVFFFRFLTTVAEQ